MTKVIAGGVLAQTVVRRTYVSKIAGLTTELDTAVQQP